MSLPCRPIAGVVCDVAVVSESCQDERMVVWFYLRVTLIYLVQTVVVCSHGFYHSLILFFLFPPVPYLRQ